MEKIIKEVKTEIGEATLNLKDGRKIKTPTKTINTIYTDGTNDCRVEIQKPLDLKGNQEEVK